MTALQDAEAFIERMKVGRWPIGQGAVTTLIAHALLDERNRHAGERLLNLAYGPFHGNHVYMYVVPEEDLGEGVDNLPPFVAIDLNNGRTSAELHLTLEQARELDHQLQDRINEMEHPS